jgi:hypothetical protein
VRCPACGFTGEEGLFRDGCPVCGYSTAPGGKPLPQTTGKKEHPIPAGDLPLWVYLTAIGALILLMWAVINYLF